ncbi:uncharacterized protein LOC130990040 [Salvia miltiorrhiza]|uniref:uncharacterized protein LOC130990040 n=1 Tax=Salvia miltiorrhiza TaxID=226208 RepID=UPI0025ACCF4B|nr:uncharacterized protein LOC130990040 [Salvia miltiorrhiza]
MMFATRGGLNDACSSVAKQLDNVYSSISVTERDMSLKIHRVDCKYDVVADNTTATKEEVSVLRGDMTSISLEIEDVTRTIQMMDSRINRMEVNQVLFTMTLHQIRL